MAIEHNNNAMTMTVFFTFLILIMLFYLWFCRYHISNIMILKYATKILN